MTDEVSAITTDYKRYVIIGSRGRDKSLTYEDILGLL